MIRDKRDAHGKELTDDRLAYTSGVAQLAIGGGWLEWADIGSYKASEAKTTAIIRRRPKGQTVPKAEWKRNIFRSDTGIERGIRRMLDPTVEVDDDQRVRVFMSSVHSDSGFLNTEDAEALVRMACLPSIEED